MTGLSPWKKACVVFALCAATAIASPAQIFNSLVSFDVIDGDKPFGVSLVQGRDGNFYGTTTGGINNNCIDGCGTLFRITPSGALTTGALTTVYSFCSQTNCSDGAGPYSGVILGTDGSFYGTTYGGGPDPNACEGEAFGCGTIFKITSAGRLTTLYSFCPDYPSCTDGDRPYDRLVQASDGNFYGTTSEGGSYKGCLLGCGTVFKITPTGTLTTLYSFCAREHCSDGSSPQAGLIQATDGNFYGTNTLDGDVNNNCIPGGCGTVFRITPGGRLTTLYNFCTQGFPSCPDGFEPTGLVEGLDGNLYGTTVYGGASGSGTVFKITPEGGLSTIHSFCSQINCTDGAFPYVGLIQATDGNLYGMAEVGGIFVDCPHYEILGCGTIFEITPGGTLTTLHSFDFTDGSNPENGVLQSTDGNFYGSVWGGGNGNSYCGITVGCGTVFSLSMGLGPFVTFVRPAGNVGQSGGILGQGFTGTTSVAINGIPANFTVVSDTYIRATVPAGATTGYVTVTTPTGTLTSNVPFHVIP